MNLLDVVEELVQERGLDRSVLTSIISEGMLSAYQRKYPELPLKVEYNPSIGEISILVEKEVVSSVDSDLTQMSLKKARFIDKNSAVGEKLWVPFEGKIGRVEILKARQVIASNIRKVEAEAVYNEFKDKLGEILHGTIHKCERSGTSVKVDDHLAFLPKGLSSPNDKCIVGHPIRALVKEVLLEPRNENQIILDRASGDFLRQLLELEIPEIFEKLVEIKKIVRIPGYKSKIIVSSNDANIDPVGTCVGVGGSRIKPILKELGSEKIDIIPWIDSKELLVKNALKPAQIDRVEISDDGLVARVWVDEDQRSVAIGKMGQNISLASKLVDLDIQLAQQEKPASSDGELDTEIDEKIFE